MIIEQAFRYHRQILATIKNRDAQTAEKNMVCHLQETVKRFQEAMEMDLKMDWAHNSEQE